MQTPETQHTVNQLDSVLVAGRAPLENDSVSACEALSLSPPTPLTEWAPTKLALKNKHRSIHHMEFASESMSCNRQETVSTTFKAAQVQTSETSTHCHVWIWAHCYSTTTL